MNGAARVLSRRRVAFGSIPVVVGVCLLATYAHMTSRDVREAIPGSLLEAAMSILTAAMFVVVGMATFRAKPTLLVAAGSVGVYLLLGVLVELAPYSRENPLVWPVDIYVLVICGLLGFCPA